jgi:3-oxoacyl-[acyl-carrier protein] reductase
MTRTAPGTLDLTGKIAIVTGASRLQGIGAAICLEFARHGADVFFTSWQPYDRDLGIGVDDAGPAELQRQLTGMGVRAASLEVDLSKPDSANEILDAATRSLGSPSILVNNAAHSTLDDYETLDAASLDAHYAVNVRAMAQLSVEFARRFKGTSGGRIINISSGQGVTPMPGELAYATTKGAVEAFTTSLAAGVAARGITVNAIDPGATDTGWMSDELRSDIAARMAFGRIGHPSDAAALAVFLASDAGGWITGQVIHSRGA